MGQDTEDLSAIRQTLATYNLAGDRMRLADLAATFLQDGVLVTPTAEYRGRADIIAGLSGGARARPSPAPDVRRPTVVRHHLTTSHVTLDGPDAASGRTYFIVFTDVGPDHAGHYQDQLRKVDGVWFFARRDVRIDWISEASLFGGLRAAHEARLGRRTT